MAREYAAGRKTLLGEDRKRSSVTRTGKLDWRSTGSLRLVFLGPPGAGKGTLAALVARDYRIPHVSTGDLFRHEVSQATALGADIREILGKGGLVPDPVTIRIVRGRLAQPDARRGYVLDGFPRTVHQALCLEQFESIDAVVRFKIPDEVVVQRVAGRRICGTCGAIYHVIDFPPKSEGVCDRCGGPLITRPDDSPEAVQNRLRLYRDQTAPLLRFYESRHLLYNLDSSVSPAYSLAQIANIFGRPEP